MLHLVLNNIFIDLAHKIVLWLKFYKTLTLVYEQIESNINSFEMFISKKIAENSHLLNDYDFVVDLETIIDFLKCLEKTVFCLMVYDNCVYSYTKTVIFNIRTLPKNVSGISDIKQPVSNRNKYITLLKTCKQFRKKILFVKDINSEK